MSKNNDYDAPLVYSTAGGKKSVKSASKKSAMNPVKNDGIVRIMKQTKGKKGAGVSIVTGLPYTGAELKKLAKDLKKKCGVGGTIKDGTIEIQGDKRDVLKAELEKLGLQVKLAGG